jgi:hypothetical protein
MAIPIDVERGRKANGWTRGRSTRPPTAVSKPCASGPGVTEGWLSEFPRQVVTESKRSSAGGVPVLTRMAELLFVEVLRRHVEADRMQPTGGPCSSLTPL